MRKIIKESNILNELNNISNYDTEGGWRYCLINSTKTKVYTKYFTGTTDADTHTNINHGVTGSKVLSATVVIERATQVPTEYYFWDVYIGGVSGYSTVGFVNSTQIDIYHEAQFQSMSYKVKIEYYL